MGKDELVGNLATENIVAWCDRKGIDLSLDREAFGEALMAAGRIFN